MNQQLPPGRVAELGVADHRGCPHLEGWEDDAETLVPKSRSRRKIKKKLEPNLDAEYPSSDTSSHYSGSGSRCP